LSALFITAITVVTSTQRHKVSGTRSFGNVVLLCACDNGKSRDKYNDDKPPFSTYLLHGAQSCSRS